MSNLELTLVEKLNYVQTTLKAPKDLYNAFGKYKYRSAESILEAVKPLLNEVGAVITLDDHIEYIGERYYLVVTATFTDKSGEQVTAQARAREDEDVKGMSLSQITGATSSYARKYCLNGLLLIDDNQDADGQSPENKPSSTGAKKAAPAQKPAEKPKTQEPAKNTAAPVKEDKKETPDEAKSKAAALDAFQKLDEAKVLNHLITKRKLMHPSLKDFIQKTPIDTVREIYNEVSASCVKDAPAEEKK